MPNSDFQSLLSQVKSAIGKGQLDNGLSLSDSLLDQCTTDAQKCEALYVQAVTLRLSGQHDRAEHQLNSLLRLNPEHARAYQELGYIYLAANHPQQAAVSFYRATQRNPALITSWKALEPLYGDMGNKQAQQIAKQQINQLNALPPPILGAKDLFFEGNIGAAEKVCRQFLQANKHHPQGMVLLAQIAIQLNVYSDADFLLESCLELYPDNIEAATEYIKLLIKLGQFAKAKYWVEKLLDIQPHNSSFKLAQATAMVGLGELDEAITIYHQQLKGNPEQPGTQLLLGHALKANGDFSDAVSAYKLAYTSRADFGDAYWSLANTKTYRFDDQELQRMQQQVSSDSISLDDKVHLLFALGKAYEDRENYAQSFDYYQQGNQLKAQQTGYQSQHIHNQVEQQISHFSQAFVDANLNQGFDAPDPIFIVGLPRAGSTLLEQILASHSQVDGTMELHNILGLVSRLRGSNNAYPSNLKQIEPQYFERFGKQFIDETQVYRQNAPFFIDKMPNNFMHIGLIKLILPNAKIIDARREPMACCFSGFKQLFGDGQHFTYGLENIGRYYRDYVRLMEHWDEVLPGHVLKVQHEDVIDDLEGQVKRILAFCGLPFEQACVNYHQTKRVIKTPSSEQVRQPIFRQSMQQWKHYEPWLGPLKTALNSPLS